MLSHVETPGAGAAGIKLFGKVITTQPQQPAHRSAALPAPPRQVPQASGRWSVGLLEEAARARAAAAEARLPCPRCRSRDTKFCYFNNYNVNQPRHFCRACHRYWTAGGALRNVPVGSGRRKNRAMLPSSAHVATATASDDQGSGSSGSTPMFSTAPAGFFALYHDASSHITVPPAAYNAAGVTETTELWRWHVTSTAERSVTLDRTS